MSNFIDRRASSRSASRTLVLIDRTLKVHISNLWASFLDLLEVVDGHRFILTSAFSTTWKRERKKRPLTTKAKRKSREHLEKINNELGDCFNLFSGREEQSETNVSRGWLECGSI